MNKSKVIRLTEKEIDLIQYLRKNDVNKTLYKSLLQVKSNLLKNNNSDDNLINDLRILISLTRNNSVDISLNYLDYVDISKEDLSFLLSEINKENNIIITGMIGAGKTCLLNYLTNQQKNYLLYLNNNELEINLKEETYIYNEVKDITNNFDFTFNNNHKNKKMIINEINGYGTAMQFLNCLVNNVSIITTIPFENKNWKDKIEKIFYGDLKNLVKAQLSNKKFIQIDITMKNCDTRRQVKIIH